MQHAVIFCGLLATTRALVGVSPFLKSSSLRSTAEPEEPLVVSEPPVVTEPPIVTEPPVVTSRMQSSDEWYTRAFPWIERPALLDGTLAADGAFDPFGFVNSKVDLYTYREAEIKHARLAMLGAVGWILAELWDTPIAKVVGLPSILEANNGRDPSILNGGLGLISPFYWTFVIGFTAAIELRGEYLKTVAKESDKTWMLSGSWVPGDLGFDPLNLYTTLGGSETQSKYLMQTAELKNGRLAMLAILAFVIEEFVSGKPVVDLSPILFTPFPRVVEDLMLNAPPLYY